MNSELASHDYRPGVVEEFQCLAKFVLTNDDGSDTTGYVLVTSNTLTVHDAPPKGTIDCEIQFPASHWTSPFPWRNQDGWVQGRLASGDLGITGNIARAMYFNEGIIRRADDKLLDSLERRVG